MFIDATHYLGLYKLSAHQLAMRMVKDVLAETGITATAGIGTNLYLAKVAMDIVAKHTQPDNDGVRIAELDEMSYRRQLWDHQPLTDFWRVGGGIARRLKGYGINTMGQLARMSEINEELLYRLFGVNAELLIDHAWGYEPCTMEMVKAYKPAVNSLSSGQVLQEAYDYKKARVVVQEMAEAVALDLVDKQMVADQLALSVGYDRESLTRTDRPVNYHGPVVTDYYGRQVPKPAHGLANLGRMTSSSRLITHAVMDIFKRVVDPDLLVRRITITTNHVVPEEQARKMKQAPVQLDIFTDYEALRKEEEKEEALLRRERRMQETTLDIKRKFGKNALLKGLDFAEGATTRQRNMQIGGHKA